MVNRVGAAFQSLIGIVHFLQMLVSTKLNNFSSASSLGNDPRFFVILHKLMCTDSIALVA